MALAGDTLFIAGPPDVVDEQEAAANLGDPEIQAQLSRQRDALEGKLGGSLWAVSTGGGETLAELPLDELPVFDGMAIEDGRVCVSTTAGNVLCFTAER